MGPGFAPLCVCVFSSLNLFSQGSKVIIQHLDNDADCIYCIRAVSVDIRSAEMKLCPLIQRVVPLIINSAIILSDSKAHRGEETSRPFKMDVCFCLWDDSLFQSGPLCSNPR